MPKISSPMVCLVANEAHPQAAEALARALRVLAGRGVTAVGDTATARLARKGAMRGMGLEAAARSAQLVVALGGDGTLLRAVHAAVAANTPLLGVNLGRRGYVTAVGLDELERRLGEALDGKLKREKRTLLQAEVLRRARVVSHCQALNDVVITKGAQARLVELEARLDGRPLTSYMADGLIVATPTGSTAYALSVGGPLLAPDLPAMVLAPIAPHTLSHRPLVVSDSSVLELSIPQSGMALLVAADGQSHFQPLPGDTVRVRKSPRSAVLLTPQSLDWRETLRVKLGWKGN